VIAQNVIPDVYVLDLERKGERLVILHEGHHLLRRFGQVELVYMKEGEGTPFTLRQVADEIWSMIAGGVQLTLVDKRQGSPSETQSMRLELSGTRPKAVLIPFGVAYRITAAQDSQLIRITTHLDGMHAEDRNFSLDEVNTLDSTV
jgi:dTDP-4-dehydrorhamnose 3,5-epimerase-like enzyme